MIGYLIENVMRDRVGVTEQRVFNQRIDALQNDVDEIHEIIQQFDDVIDGEGRQYDVVRRHHSRPAEHDQCDAVSGQPYDADDWIDDKSRCETREIVEVFVRQSTDCVF